MGVGKMECTQGEEALMGTYKVKVYFQIYLALRNIFDSHADSVQSSTTVPHYNNKDSIY